MRSGRSGSSDLLLSFVSGGVAVAAACRGRSPGDCARTPRRAGLRKEGEGDDLSNSRRGLKQTIKRRLQFRYASTLERSHQATSLLRKSSAKHFCNFTALLRPLSLAIPRTLQGPPCGARVRARLKARPTALAESRGLRPLPGASWRPSKPLAAQRFRQRPMAKNSRLPLAISRGRVPEPTPDDPSPENITLAAGLGLHDTFELPLLTGSHFNRYSCWHNRQPTKSNPDIQSYLWDITLDSPTKRARVRVYSKPLRAR